MALCMAICQDEFFLRQVCILEEKDIYLIKRYLIRKMVTDLANKELSRLTALHLGRWHRCQVAGAVSQSKESALWLTLKQWLSCIPFNKNEQNRHKSEPFYNFDWLEQQIYILKDVVEKAKNENTESLAFDAVFCHNDLLAANIVYDEHTNKINFIDYEYGGYNFRGFE